MAASVKDAVTRIIRFRVPGAARTTVLVAGAFWASYTAKSGWLVGVDAPAFLSAMARGMASRKTDLYVLAVMNGCTSGGFANTAKADVVDWLNGYE